MKQATIDELAFGAAAAAERIIAKEHKGGPSQRKAALQVMFGEFLTAALNREERNRRRRIEPKAKRKGKAS